MPLDTHVRGKNKCTLHTIANIYNLHRCKTIFTQVDTLFVTMTVDNGQPEDTLELILTQHPTFCRDMNYLMTHKPSTHDDVQRIDDQLQLYESTLPTLFQLHDAIVDRLLQIKEFKLWDQALLTPTEIKDINYVNNIWLSNYSTIQTKINTLHDNYTHLCTIKDNTKR